MTTTLIYVNLACALLATMCFAGTNPYAPFICITWLAASAYWAKREGLLDEN
ncbi:MAG: hypothetical protein HUK04_00865 [Bacteroidaceae bacterium]|nr:hypothetical protein [Bacteroidaceae bacterium]